MRRRLAYWGLRVAVGLIGLLPFRIAQGIGGRLGVVWHQFDSRRRHMARRHMSRVLGPESAETAGLEVMRSYGRYWAEVLWVRASRIPEVLSGTRVEGLEEVARARDEGKGMIYALPHMGNWETAAPVAGNIGVPVVAVAEKLPNRLITDWFTTMRAHCGIEIVLATGGTDVMRRLESALSQNKAVALPSDRDLKGKGVDVEFFGERTTMPPGPATLAIRTGAPLLPVVSYFEGSGHRIVIRPPIPVPAEGSRGEKVALMTQELARHFEEFVRAAPEQWHLVVPNWPSDVGAG